MEDTVYTRCAETVRIAYLDQRLPEPRVTEDPSDIRKIKHLTAKMTGILNRQALDGGSFKPAGHMPYQETGYA
jgi:hypothetical protein